jgi:Domain of unknown function (DUF5018)
MFSFDFGMNFLCFIFVIILIIFYYQNKITMLKNYALLILLGLVFTFSGCKETETVPKSSAKAITKLTFPQFTPAVQATIDEATKRITAIVPPTADITILIPSISVSLKAKVLPDSGKVQDFTNDVTYTVTAEDGTKQDYKVMVSRTKFSGKDILTFTFADFTPAVVAKIDPATKTITATVPATADLTKLKPTITLSDRATVNPVSATVVDFTKAVNFTVTAEDAGTQVYAVTVAKEAPVVVSNLPSSITYLISAIQATDPITEKYTWDKGILTKIVETRGTSTKEKIFIRDKDDLIIRIDVNDDGDKYSQIYRYSADKKTVYDTDTSHIWKYNDKKLLIKRTTAAFSIYKETNLDLTWYPDINLVNAVADAKYLCTVTGWSGSNNPLWEITKQTQFLYTNDYNYPTVILYLSEKVSNPWEFKSLTSTAKNTVINTTKEDSQKRITNIRVEQSGLLVQDMTIRY